MTKIKIRTRKILAAFIVFTLIISAFAVTANASTNAVVGLNTPVSGVRYTTDSGSDYWNVGTIIPERSGTFTLTACVRRLDGVSSSERVRINVQSAGSGEQWISLPLNGSADSKSIQVEAGVSYLVYVPKASVDFSYAVYIFDY